MVLMRSTEYLKLCVLDLIGTKLIKKRDTITSNSDNNLFVNSTNHCKYKAVHTKKLLRKSVVTTKAPQKKNILFFYDL